MIDVPALCVRSVSTCFVPVVPSTRCILSAPPRSRKTPVSPGEGHGPGDQKPSGAELQRAFAWFAAMHRCSKFPDPQWGSCRAGQAVAALHAFEWLFVRMAPLLLVAAAVGIFLTRKKA